MLVKLLVLLFYMVKYYPYWNEKLIVFNDSIMNDVNCSWILLIDNPGVLEDGVDEFETPEDLYEAIGVMLQQSDESKSEEDMKEICERLHSLLHE